MRKRLEPPGKTGAKPTPSLINVYDDEARAAAYATLEFPGTYYLAFRDLPALISAHASGRQALDFGCGTGRSTRFLERLGFDVTGVDISPSMLERARTLDPNGRYLLVPDGDLGGLPTGEYDLILSAFTFDNIPEEHRRISLLTGLRKLLRTDTGRIVMLGSAPDIYLHEWLSFTTLAFPENREARSGDAVRIVMTDVADSRPVVDVLSFDEDYQRICAKAGLHILTRHQPLGRPDEPFEWKTESTISPWVVYVLAATAGAC